MVRQAQVITALAGACFLGAAQAGTLTVNNFANGTDNATGISSSITYTHAIDIRQLGDAAVINGVTFDNTLGSWNLASTPFNFDNNTSNNGADPSSELYKMLDTFKYNGKPGVLTVSGLTPGTTYKLRLYVTHWTGPLVDFTFDDTAVPTVVSSISRGAGQVIPSSFDYVYTLGAGDTDLVVSIDETNLNAGTFHWYGFTNEVVPEPSSLALLGLGSLLIARRRRG